MKVIPEENSEDQAFWALDLCAISFSDHLKVPEQKQFGSSKSFVFWPIASETQSAHTGTGYLI
jgi:hypothetical protein